MSKAVVIFSGGMDSSALAFMLAEEFDELLLLSFDYGQRHVKELESAQALAEFLGRASMDCEVTWRPVDLTSITSLLGGSALTDDIEVPDGHYTWDTARITVVPNRNMMMLSIAVAAAVAWKAERVYTGVHAGDHFVYPDCRPEFIKAVNSTSQLANEGFTVEGFNVLAPWLYMEKSDIALVGEEMQVPWHLTWSCYKGGEIHCGKCPTCVERLEAFFIAGVTDATEYEDSTYWKSVTEISLERLNEDQ